MTKEAQEAERRLIGQHPPDIILSPDEVQDLREALKRSEWCGGAIYCPVCDRYKSRGHADDCKLVSSRARLDQSPTDRKAT